MAEICPYCNKPFENTKALGSHIHYVHEFENLVSTSQERSETEKERFAKLFSSCLGNSNLPMPKQVEKVEQALAEIPEGISSTLDQYRNAYRCAIGKENLLKEIEKELKGD